MVVEDTNIQNNMEEKKNIWGLNRPLRIIDCPWHLAHQWDMMSTLPDVQWFWLAQHRRPYSEGPRGDFYEKFDLTDIPYYEEGKYDLAILHMDQQCFANPLWKRGKGSVYREFNETIKGIPKIVIMHGTPYFPETFSCDIQEENYTELGYTKEQVGMSSVLIEKCKEEIGDNVMVVNSHRAVEQWGHGTAIIHGMDPNNWLDLPKEPRVVTMISPGGLDKYYDRTFLAAIKDALAERDITHCHITVDAQFKNFEDYRDFLGHSLIYINPTKESPMPRARTEAMLSGCCVLTTPHQDADGFIQDGVNGFLIPRNPHKVADLVEELLNDYDRAVEVGQAGRAMALGKFSMKNYESQWTELITKTLKDYADKK